MAAVFPPLFLLEIPLEFSPVGKKKKKKQVLGKSRAYNIETYMVIMGATASKLAIRMPISAMHAVSIKARVGSPELEP